MRSYFGPYPIEYVHHRRCFQSVFQIPNTDDGKFIVAEQGGLWKATPEFIAFLSALSDDNFVILIDTFENPVLVNRNALHDVLSKAYNDTMSLWHKEWKELESKR